MTISGKPWRDVPVVLFLVAIVAVVVYPVFAQSKTDRGPSCFHNLCSLSAATLECAEGADERLPRRDGWMDAIEKSQIWSGAFRCPKAPEGAYGYAFNGALDHARIPDEDHLVPMLYDSVDPTRNASDLVASLPRPGRHSGDDILAYADGHVRSLAVK